MTDISNWLDQNSGGSSPSVGFPTVGAKVVGTIARTPRAVTTTDDNGKPQERLVVELIAGDGCTATKGKNSEPIAAGDEVSVWIKPGFMASAISEAIKEAGAKGLAEGDTLAVAFADTKDTGKIQPAKVYQARYTPAKPAVSVDSLV